MSDSSEERLTEAIANALIAILVMRESIRIESIRSQILLIEIANARPRVRRSTSTAAVTRPKRSKAGGYRGRQRFS